MVHVSIAPPGPLMDAVAQETDSGIIAITGRPAPEYPLGQ